MIRGTTAPFKFQLPYPMNEINAVKVIFWQPGNSGTTAQPLPIVKTKSSCVYESDGTELCVTLNQEETLRFMDSLKAKVQLRGLHSNGNAFASHEEDIVVYPLCENSVIGEWDEPDPVDDFVILDGGAL